MEVRLGDFHSQLFKEIVRSLIYRLLNEFEEQYDIVIMGAPFCFLPDAWDHLIYAREKGMPYQYISLCGRCRLKTTCPGIAVSHPRGGVEKILPWLRAVPDLPGEIVIEVNTECNLRCAACFASKKSDPSSLSNERIKAVLDETRRLGIKNVRFTGGEPFLRADILDLLRYAKNKGFYVLLNTNATILPKEILRCLPACVDNILISLQGYDALSEERLTRGGALFKEKITHVQQLNTSGVPVVRCGTVISRTLLTHFNKYRSLISGLGIKRWELFRPMTGDDDGPSKGEFSLKPGDMGDLVSKLWALRRCGVTATIANPLPFCAIPQEKLKTPVLSGALFDDGHTRLIRDTQGTFKPSYFIPLNLGRSIKKAWHHPFMRTLHSRTYLPAPCRRCKYLSRCLGGSRFWAARQESGTYFSRDPWMKS